MEYPVNFPVGEGGLHETKSVVVFLAETAQAVADELVNYGKRHDDPSWNVVIVTEPEHIEMLQFMTVTGWATVGDPDRMLMIDMINKYNVPLTRAQAIGMVNDQFAINPRKLLGAPVTR